ncbi:MAG: endonuclease MutS2 [Chloroflexi bacterium]|nr:endonuclease MutS2 [Chloroflexota bacterium]
MDNSFFGYNFGVNAKHFNTLELPKILERLTSYCSFQVSADLARALEPSTDVVEVRRCLAETTQARAALAANDSLTIGGARDVREVVAHASRGGVLEPQELLDVRDTLISGRNVQRAMSRLSGLYPELSAVTNMIEPCAALVNEITRCIDEKGEVRDTASPALGDIRRNVRVVHDRLMQKLQRLVTDSGTSSYLQEAIITQRGGRYVIPVKSDFKGRIPGLIHDQSASGLTLFIEPLATLELNNEWRELQLAEEREVRKVLANLSDLVSADSSFITRTVVALAQFDLALAKAKYADATRASAPAIVDAKGAVAQRSIHLQQARHPLLNPQTVVPIDVLLDANTRVLVITGPNTGGKTVALKTIGLLVLMSQCGLHVPAESATLPVFEDVLADIGDEQSIEQSLSTFSAHMTNLVSFLGNVNARSLALLDELGAGTDPAEGAALARAILEYLLKTNAFCMIATHYPELKAWAYMTEGAANASVAFDYETLRPLYKLTIGLPGRSNAFAIAQRLGLLHEILAQAQAYVDNGDARAEDMLAEIAKIQRQLESAREAAHRAQHEAERNADRMRERLSAIDDERKQMLAEAREDALREVEALRAEVRRLRARIVSAGGSLEEVKSIEKDVDTLQAAPPLPAQTDVDKRLAPLIGRRPIQVNDLVRVKTLGTDGIVSAIAGDEADVQVGRMRTRVRLSDLERSHRARASAEEVAQAEAERYPNVDRPVSPGMELDLRGLTGEEGVARLEDYLDRAARAALPFVRIIHGKGTGALRRAIRNAIKTNPLVKSFETGQEGEGGDGVTVIKLNVS